MDAQNFLKFSSRFRSPNLLEKHIDDEDIPMIFAEPRVLQAKLCDGASIFAKVASSTTRIVEESD